MGKQIFIKNQSKIFDFISLGTENTNAADKLCAFLLALSPLLQHYKGVGLHAGFCILVICLPYIGVKMLSRIRELDLRKAFVVLPLLLFQIYRVVDHGTTVQELFHGIILCVYFMAMALGGINFRVFFTSCFLIAMTAAVGVILQTICYYVFGFHLQLVVTDFLLAESQQWVALAQTGRVGVTGEHLAIYRPSAIFLEPSHMMLYLMPQLFVLLLSPQMNHFKRSSAIFLSLGLVFSTSGIGIMLVAGIWLLQLGFSSGGDNELRIRYFFRKTNILHCLIFLIIYGSICLGFPFIRHALLGRMDNAIDGRTMNAGLLLRAMSGEQLWLGVSDSTKGLNINIPGFHATLYKYGIPGRILSYIFHINGTVFTKGAYRWMSIIILLLSYFSAHTHGTFYMMYYVFALLQGYSCQTSSASTHP